VPGADGAAAGGLDVRESGRFPDVGRPIWTPKRRRVRLARRPYAPAASRPNPGRPVAGLAAPPCRSRGRQDDHRA
jgi:hypothetical protein